jgi:hypothetical protein
MNEDENREWGARGPRPKQLKEKVILGLEVGRGDNRNVVPPEEVEKLAAIGCTDTEIAAFFAIKQDTLRRNFAEQITKGRQFQKTRLRMNMFKAADNLNPAILIFLAKNILGMSDQPVNSEANTPLPWNESDETDLQLGETDEQFRETDAETDQSR